MNVTALILASGLSRRMGKQKLLLSWNHTTLLGHVLEAVKRSKLKEAVTVIPDDNHKMTEIVSAYNIDVTYNTSPGKGMGSSLALGVRSLSSRAKAVMVILADQPEIESSDINRVYDCFLQTANPEQQKLIIQVQYADKIIGHPVLFTKPFFDDLIHLKGDVGGKRIIRENQQYVKKIKSHYDYPIDIDNHNDYVRLLQRSLK